MTTNFLKNCPWILLMILPGMNTLLAQDKTITVHIIDKKLQKPAIEVDIWAKDSKGVEAYRGKTNKWGDLDFKTDLKSGRDLEIRATKSGTYVDQTKTHRVSDDPSKNKVPTFEMMTTDGNPTTIRVFNPRNNKPVDDAIIRYKNHVGELEKVITNHQGEASFPVYFPDGTDIEFTIEKPGYADLPVPFPATLKRGGSVFMFELKKQKKFRLSNYYLIGAGSALVTSGILELSSQKAYSDYKPFANNDDRESDYRHSNTRRRGAIVMLGVGIIGGVIWKITHDKEAKEAAELRRSARRSR